MAATGSDEIPVIVCEDGEIVTGELAIRRRLDERIAEAVGAEAHRSKAEKARRRYLEEECECSQPTTP